MTTIAYRDGVLAADTLITENLRAIGNARKLFTLRSERGTVAWAVTGTLIAMREVDDWIVGGMVGRHPQMKTSENACSTAVIFASRKGEAQIVMITMDEHGIDWMYAPEYHAIGSGAPLALGAMAAGATAQEAVVAACEVCIQSQLPAHVQMVRC